ncbi:hypothetical protein MMC13_000536 [Lambiella insularis]|nr:hypothetical protein [Lambiella insularis]
MSSTPTLLIAGANIGLGFETVTALLPVTQSIHDPSQRPKPTESVQNEFPQTRSTIATVQIDVEDDESIARAFEHAASRYGRVDILINNAGRRAVNSKMMMRETWNKPWNVNSTGTNILTHTFVPSLLEFSDPRLLFIASGTSTLGASEDTSIKMNRSSRKGWPKHEMAAVPAYRSSKTGMNMMMREWKRALEEDSVKIGEKDVGLSAAFVRDVVEGVRDRDDGKVVRRVGVQ